MPETFQKIGDELKPSNRAEGSMRLQFFCSAMALSSANAIQKCLDRARSGEFGEDARHLVAGPIDHESFSQAIKHLSCIAIFLTAYDQGTKLPSWLDDFLASCARAMDHFIEGNAVADIMNVYSGIDGERAYRLCARNIFDIIGLGSLRPDAGSPLEVFLRDSVNYRSKVLKYALERPVRDLEEQMREFGTADELLLN